MAQDLDGIDLYLTLAEALGVTRKEAKEAVLRMVACNPYVTASERRKAAYVAIDSERTYQDAGLGNAANGHALAPGEFLLCMEKCLADARDAWYGPNGGRTCLDYVRKAAALGVACLEAHGAPTREMPRKTYLVQLGFGGAYYDEKARQIPHDQVQIEPLTGRPFIYR